jgi:hypothetical protein
MITLDNFISKEERGDLIGLGIMSKLAEHNMSLSAFNRSVRSMYNSSNTSRTGRLIKSAGVSISPSEIIDGTAESIAAVSLLAGIPIGVAAHYIRRAAKRKSKEQLRAINRVKHYASKSNVIESELSDEL